MKEIYKRVVESGWVSSKIGTKIISVGFVLAALSLVVYSFKPSDASIASDITIQSVINLTNQSRLQSGKSGLSENEKLDRAAGMKADDMIANNYFSHTSPSGITPWRWFEMGDYDYDYAGENLAMDFHSTEKMEDAWMASPTHRANILNEKYKEIGTAIREGRLNGHDTILTVVMFGSGDKNDSAPAVSKTDTPDEVEADRAENVPALPGEEKRKDKFFRIAPYVTSPQKGETISRNEICISGWAQPGKKVSIFDSGSFVGDAVAGEDGRFAMIESDLSQGSHEISLRSEDEILADGIEFSVDQEKPRIDFHLFADKKNSNQFFLEVSTDENNCTFQLSREKRGVSRGEEAVFAISAEKSSVVLRIQDQAGNKNFQQISLANFYAPEKRGDIPEKVADYFSDDKNIFAHDRSRETIASNLGIASRQFFSASAAAGR